MFDFAALQPEVVQPHLLILRLNRPEVANALNTQMGQDLLALRTALTEDARGIRCVVFTGAGERAFWALMDCPIPVIAANAPLWISLRDRSL